MDDSNNPYLTPSAKIQDIQSENHIPPELLKKIKGGWICAIISGCLTLFIAIIAILGFSVSSFADAWLLVDVVLIFILAFGIYKKSRTASTIMFLYFLISKISIVVETGRINGLFIGVLFLYFYANAMIATYKYHNLLK